jgi:nicotinamide-nucleotide amidase
MKLTNKHGSAPGVFIEDHRGWVAMLPGVPREMRGMTDDTLIPFLASRKQSTAVIRSFTLRTTGIAESMLGEMLRPVVLPGEMSLAYLPTPEGVDLRLTLRANSAALADAALARAATELRDIIGAGVYGDGTEDLAAVVLQLCREAEHTISVAESCTGGLLGARLTAIPKSSDVVLGGVIAYHDDIKRSLLDVSAEDIRTHGAVSEAVVRQMAKGAASRFGSSVSMAITGIAGPGGGSAEKPVGTVWIAVGVERAMDVRLFNLIGDRDEIRRRSAQAALEMLRRRLI